MPWGSCPCPGVEMRGSPPLAPPLRFVCVETFTLPYLTVPCALAGPWAWRPRRRPRCRGPLGQRAASLPFARLRGCGRGGGVGLARETPTSERGANRRAHVAWALHHACCSSTWSGRTPIEPARYLRLDLDIHRCGHVLHPAWLLQKFVEGLHKFQPLATPPTGCQWRHSGVGKNAAPRDS